MGAIGSTEGREETCMQRFWG